MSVKNYTIQFAGLKQGLHEFDYEITDKFFESIDYSEVKKAKIKVKLNLLKQSTTLLLDFNISGTIKAICDRCTDEFDLPINGEFKLVVKVGGIPENDENEDVITVSVNDQELNLIHYLYEYIMLSIPIKKVHPDDKKGKSTCNKEMLEKLNSYIINKEQEQQVDPRWKDLKKINFN